MYLINPNIKSEAWFAELNKDMIKVIAILDKNNTKANIGTNLILFKVLLKALLFTFIKSCNMVPPTSCLEHVYLKDLIGFLYLS